METRVVANGYSGANHQRRLYDGLYGSRTEDDIKMMALAMTMSNDPMAVNMCFQRQYAERYEWMKQVFKDWAFNATTVFFYYNDYDNLNEDTKQIM